MSTLFSGGASVAATLLRAPELRAVYDAVRQLALNASQGAALRNLLVTRTISSVTIFSCADRAVPPIQVLWVGAGYVQVA